MKKTLAFTLGGTFLAASMNISAATVVNSWFNNLSGSASSATDGDTGTWASIGVGGSAVFEFNSAVDNFTVVEKTIGYNLDTNPLSYQESVSVFVSNNATADTFNFTDTAIWTQIATISNAESYVSGGITKSLSDSYKFIGFFDTSENKSGRNGYDIASLSGSANVSSVPIPAALPLFMSALAGLGFVGFRRRNA